MDKNINKFLKRNSKKRTTMEAIFEEESLKKIKEAIAILFILLVAFFINFFVIIPLFANQEKCVTKIGLSLIMIIVEIFALSVIGFPLYFLGEYLFVTLPVLLRRKYLPLTEEEIKNLDMNEEEFYEFLYKVCNRSKNGTDFEIRLHDDAITMLALFNKLEGNPEIYIGNSCNEDLRKWLEK